MVLSLHSRICEMCDRGDYDDADSSVYPNVMVTPLALSRIIAAFVSYCPKQQLFPYIQKSIPDNKCNQPNIPLTGQQPQIFV